MADPLASYFGQPRSRVVHAVRETTFGSFAAPAATDAFKMLSGGIADPQPMRENVHDFKTTRSVLERVSGNIPPTSWSYEGYLRPSGTAGTPPDVHPLLLGAIGGTDGYTNTPSTSDAYAFSNDPTAIGSCSLYEMIQAVTGIYMKQLAGAVVEEIKISGAGGAPPKVSFSGWGARHVLTGRSTMNGAASGTSVTLDNIENAQQYSRFAIYEAADGTTVVDSNSGAGFVANSISGSVITASGSPAGTADEDVFAPFLPAPTTAGSAIPGAAGSISLGGASVPVMSYEFSVKNNIVAHDDEAFQTYATGYHIDYREVSGQFTVKAKASTISQLGLRNAFGTRSLSLVIGSTAGSILTIAASAVEYQFADLEQPETGPAVITIPFVCLASSGDDEATLTFT